MTDDKLTNIFNLSDCPFEIVVREPCKGPLVTIKTSRLHRLTAWLIKIAFKLGNASAWIDGKDGKGKFESDSMDEAYFDRNQAAMLAASLACQLDLPVGWKANADDPEWPILMIELPNEGQVSWHIPQREWMDLGIGEWHKEWDGHDLAEKRWRIEHYLIHW